MFGKAKVKGEVVEVFIENLFKSDDVLVHAYCRFIGKNEWGGVYPEQFIETYHNPEHPYCAFVGVVTNTYSLAIFF
jgi:hypothetical protein